MGRCSVSSVFVIFVCRSAGAELKIHERAESRLRQEAQFYQALAGLSVQTSAQEQPEVWLVGA